MPILSSRSNGTPSSSSPLCVCARAPIANCPATGGCFAQSVYACGNSVLALSAHLSMHVCVCGGGGGGRARVRAKAVIQVMLKLRGSTFLHSY